MAQDSEPIVDAAEALKTRLRTDLESAMQARATSDVAVLRAMIAALDNAQAVPAGDRHVRHVAHAFGDPGVEVQRLSLGAGTVRALLEREAESRREAAGQFEGLGRTDKAAELRAQAMIVRRYLDR
jgi:uncharacterized protein YqeY